MAKDNNNYAVEVGIKDYPPDKAYETFKKIASILYEGHPETYKTGTDEEILEQFTDDLHHVADVLNGMANCVRCAGKEHPRLLKAWQGFVSALGACSHTFYSFMGYNPEIELPDGEDFYSQVWRLDGDFDEDTFPTVCWMIDKQATNIVKQMFPIKNSKELSKAMYNFFAYLAATTASEHISEYQENCDWGGLLENGQFLERTKKQEYVVEGVNVTNPKHLGNPHLKKEKINVRKEK